MNEEIKKFAKSLGFHLVSIIPSEPLKDDEKHLSEWIKNGYFADLKYMLNGDRANPEKILPRAKSMICLAMNYYQKADKKANVARYAWGKDYHVLIEKKLKN